MIITKEEFLSSTDWADCKIEKMAGDASIKKFYRLVSNKNKHAVLMEMPLDDSEYTKEASLARNCLPFLAVGEWLRSQNISVPNILAKNVAAGFILLEDFGTQFYTKKDIGLAVETLNHLHSIKAPDKLVFENQFYELPQFNKEICVRESLLFLEWFLPSKNITINDDAKNYFVNFWEHYYEYIQQLDNFQTILLRDYHSPNFIILPERENIKKLGVLDFQDALRGTALYDLVSLIQDARIDVSAAQEHAALKIYQHNFNPKIYALLGAQRAFKILGIFTRFAKQDNKLQYIKHLPRMIKYLKRNLSNPELSPLNDWLTKNAPNVL